eukprot:Trichotokara_eunicae@DN266_c0_g1_i1.p1
MWWGNLVTPRHQKDVWLKEGTARFLEYLIVQGVSDNDTEWDERDFFVDVCLEVMAADHGLTMKPHPVQIKTLRGGEKDLLAIYDCLSYGKAAILLRMIKDILGLEAILDCFRSCLVSHQSTAITPDDLWKKLKAPPNWDDKYMTADDDGIFLEKKKKKKKKKYSALI